MCAISEAKIKDKEINIYMGYYGGYIKIDDSAYGDSTLLFNEKRINKEEIIKYLNTFTKDELSNLIINLIDNSVDY